MLLYDFVIIIAFIAPSICVYNKINSIVGDILFRTQSGKETNTIAPWQN
jgi:hypothetical protein